jgi:hypothetical protein
MADLFDTIDIKGAETTESEEKIYPGEKSLDRPKIPDEGIRSFQILENKDVNIRRIVWFYENGSFEEFFPRKG